MKNLTEVFLPAITKETSKLLEAGKISNQLQQILQGQSQLYLSRVKLKDFGIIEFLKETIAKNPNNAVILNQYVRVLEACGELFLTEMSEVIQSFGQSANLHAESLVKDVNMEDCYPILKVNEEKQNA